MSLRDVLREKQDSIEHVIGEAVKRKKKQHAGTWEFWSKNYF